MSDNTPWRIQVTTCAAKGCTIEIEPGGLLCSDHYAMVPRDVARRLGYWWNQYRQPGNSADKKGFLAEWRRARAEAIAATKRRAARGPA